MGYRVKEGRQVDHNNKLYSSGAILPPDVKDDAALSLLHDGAIVEGSTIVHPEATATLSSVQQSAANKTEEGAIVSLNNGDDAQLRTLPGVGPAISKKLRDARPFETLAEAETASGLTPDQWAQIEPLITL